MTPAPSARRVVLGMTLCNNARHLREAADSLMGQTYQAFALLMLDDGSTDDTERVAREYEQRDPRVRYFRHEQRQGMVPTWREVVEIAVRDVPRAEYFAWVSDHDRWHPAWLARMVAELDAAPDVVLVYPVTLRIDEQGAPADKEPRSFQTVGITDIASRWRAFCHHGVGSGDMVYGLMRLEALRVAGIFRPVLNPDRLLVAELTLQGQIRQVPEPLWWRRQSAVPSVTRQRTTLFSGPPPRWFGWPPTVQHAIAIVQAYRRTEAPPVRLSAPRLAWMLALYQVTSAWRHFRKTDVSKSVGRGVDNAHWVKKIIRKGVHHAVYYTLVGVRTLRGRCRRAGRRAVYEFLMLTHRLGLRGPRGGARTP